MEHLTLVVCKARQVSPVLLARHDFGILALDYIVYLNRFILTCCHNKFALVVEIERCDVRVLMLRKFESLVE